MVVCCSFAFLCLIQIGFFLATQQHLRIVSAVHGFLSLMVRVNSNGREQREDYVRNMNFVIKHYINAGMKT